MAKAQKLLPQISEKEWSKQFRELAALYGWECYVPWLSIHSPRGFPDVTCCRVRNGVGELLFVELKTETGKVSLSQQAWIDRLNTVPGIRAFVFRPRDFDAALEILKGRTGPEVAPLLRERARETLHCCDCEKSGTKQCWNSWTPDHEVGECLNYRKAR